MSHIVIAFGTTEGHTAKIAEFTANVLIEAGHRVTTINLMRVRQDLPLDTDAVIVAASLHLDRFQAEVSRFIAVNRQRLRALPTAWLTVCMAAASADPNEREAVRTLTKKLLSTLFWRPGQIELVVGALKYSQYGWLTKRIMRWIPPRQGATCLDLTRDYDLTDYAALRRFAKQFGGKIAPAEASPPVPAA